MNAWLLLRGLTRDTRHWGDFPGRLAERFPQVPIVPVDLAGNGRRHREPSPADVAAMLQDARAAAAEAGLRAPFGVVAMSLGAMVTTAWARAHPHDLAAAVLVSTSLRPFSPLTARLRPSAWADVLRAGLARDPVDAESAVWRLTSRRPDADRDAVVARWAEARRTHPVSTGNALRQLWAAARHRAPSRPPSVPMLLLAGAGDRLVDPACSAALSRVWRLPLRVHPWAGHDLPLDDPEWVADEIREWASGPSLR